jgi:hypothetical protein
LNDFFVEKGPSLIQRVWHLYRAIPTKTAADFAILPALYIFAYIPVADNDAGRTVRAVMLDVNISGQHEVDIAECHL